MEKKKLDGGREAFQKKVIDIIACQLDLPISDVHPTSKLCDDLGCDDLATVEIILAFEDNFEMDIPDSAMMAEGGLSNDTVQDILDYFDKRIEFT